jgi:hypothetical protein
MADLAPFAQVLDPIGSMATLSDCVETASNRRGRIRNNYHNAKFF